MVNSATNTTTVTLHYGVLPKDGSRPELRVLSTPDPVTGEYNTKNYGFEGKTVAVENVRGKEDSVSLDTTGFQFFKQASKLTPSSFTNENTIKTEYYSESIDLIKKLTGATRVEVFDHSTFVCHLPICRSEY